MRASSCAARRAGRCRRARTTCCARRACWARSRARARAARARRVRRPEVIGAPFYVMELVEGHVDHDRAAGRAGRPTRTAARIGEELVDALVEIHAVDWQAAGLEGFGKPTGYLERQLRRFLGLWEINRTREIPAVESVARWLAENLPQSGPGDGRARRLPPRQHDVRAGRAGAARRGLRLGDGDDRRSARRPRLPVHAVGRSRRPAAAACSSSAASRASRASRRAPSSSPATRSAPAAR